MDKDGNIGIEPGTETVYGTHDDNTMVMSEKVRPAQTNEKKNENHSIHYSLPYARPSPNYDRENYIQIKRIVYRMSLYRFFFVLFGSLNCFGCDIHNRAHASWC